MNRLFAKRFLPALLVAGTVSLAANGGCGSGGGTSPIPPNYALPTTTPTPTPTDGPETTRGSYQDLHVTFTVPKHNYAVGEVVPMTFTVQNKGTTNATFQNVSNTFVDTAIRTPDGKNVSAVSSTEVTDTIKPARLTQVYTLVLAAGQTRTFFLQWDQTAKFFTPDGNPTQTAPGTYVLTGEITPSDLNGSPTPELPAPPILITIR